MFGECIMQGKTSSKRNVT